MLSGFIDERRDLANLHSECDLLAARGGHLQCVQYLVEKPGRMGGPWGEAAGRPSPMPDTAATTRLYYLTTLPLSESIFVWSILIAEINKTNIMKCFIRALREFKVTFNRKGLIVDRTEAITYKRLHNKIFRRVSKRLSPNMNLKDFFKKHAIENYPFQYRGNYLQLIFTFLLHYY